MKAGLLVRANLPRYIILGDKGSFVKYGLDVQELQLNSGLLPGDEGYGIEPDNNSGTLRIDLDGEKFKERLIKTEAGDYQKYYQNIYNAIANGDELFVKPRDAVNNIKIIELAIQSNAERKTLDL